jgi:Zn-dependent protease with chaperone function
VNSGIKNAFALPGGRIYLFDGLLQVAQAPDEIAGVLAHEMGHVKNRDAMRRLIETGGTSFLFGLLFGDVTGSGAVILASRELLESSYSRDVEARADGVAIDVMHGLGRSLRPMGELLMRVTGDQKDSRWSFLASHPMTGDRMQRFLREDRPETGRPILDFGEWRALKAICHDAP